MNIARAASLVAVLAFVATATPATAQLDLGHPSLTPFTASNISNFPTGDRNVIFDALSNVSITFAGIMMNPLAQRAGTIQANLYSMAQTGGIGTRGRCWRRTRSTT